LRAAHGTKPIALILLTVLGLLLYSTTRTNADWSQYSGGSGGGGGSGTVGNGNAGQVAYYQSTGTTVIGNSNLNISGGTLTIGTADTTGGVVILEGSTSGSSSLAAPATGGSPIILPATGTANYFLQLTDASTGATAWAAAGGGGSGTVSNGTAGQITWYQSTGTTVVGNANATMSSGTLTLGQSGTAGAVVLTGSSSGAVTLQVAAAAGSGTVFQFPASNATTGFLLKTTGSGVTQWTTNLNEQSGVLTIGNSSGPTAGQIVLEGSSSGSSSIAAPATGGTAIILPASGTTNQFLQLTNSSTGATAWASPSGSGTVSSGTAGNLTWYQATGTTVVGNTNANMSSGTLTLGQSTSVAGALVLEGASSGAVTVQVPATAGSTTFQLPGSNGSSGQLLYTNGSGVTAWTPDATIATGTLTLGTSGTGGSVVLNGSTSGTVTVSAPATAGATTFVLPPNNGTSGYVLQTDGSGNTSWVASGGGLSYSAITADPGPASLSTFYDYTATASGETFTLPSASSNAGKQIWLRVQAASTYPVTLQTTSSQSIVLATSFASGNLMAGVPGDMWIFTADGSNWKALKKRAFEDPVPDVVETGATLRQVGSWGLANIANVGGANFLDSGTTAGPIDPTGTISNAVSSAGQFMEMATSSSTGNAAYTAAGQTITEPRLQPFMEWKFQSASSVPAPGASNGVRIWVGLSSINASTLSGVTTPSSYNILAVGYDSNIDTNQDLYVVSSNGSSVTRTDSGIAYNASTVYSLAFDERFANAAIVTINGKSLIVTSTLPSSSTGLFPVMSVTNTGSAAQYINWGNGYIVQN
jgi:hypothetical protein